MTTTKEPKGQPPSEDERVRRPSSEAAPEHRTGAVGGARTPDPVVLEERVRGELQRLLGRQVKVRKEPGQTAPAIDLELLEGRIREILWSQFERSGTWKKRAKPLPPGLDLELLEREVRRQLRTKLEEGESAGAPSPISGVDRDLLRRRVREEIRRALERNMKGDGGTEDTVDRQLLETRLRQEMARRIPAMKELGWDGRTVGQAEPPIDRELLADRMRKSIRRALRDYRVVASSRLTDAEIERMIGRLLP